MRGLQPALRCLPHIGRDVALQSQGSSFKEAKSHNRRKCSSDITCDDFPPWPTICSIINGGPRPLRRINAFWEKSVLARSHIKFWLGDLVISKGTSRRREEQNGEVSALMIGGRCFA
jgi:hypothetical protein